MNRYGMYLKNGKDLIHLTQQENTEQAIKFFTDIKKLCGYKTITRRKVNRNIFSSRNKRQ